MSDIAIKVENLSKSYMLGHNAAQSERYTALRDVIAHNAKNLARKTRDMFQGKTIVQGDKVEEFWALKDINFEIKQGDRVGIIGRNGAGKSTLLKILSRITEPTTGRIQINGRVASLLEVGTGFHPELTGRENIFLNGAILGMSRREIQRKFDEIVDFAEVEKFLDTPVKRYSSGMYVRLAFAVAAHLEPEILIVDEVLAVGDAQFQKKCLGKMQDVGCEGRTVLFVSHNMSAIKQLCRSAFLFNSGNLIGGGTPESIIEQYLGITNEVKKTLIEQDVTKPHIDHIGIYNTNGEELNGVNSGEEVVLRISISTLNYGRLIFGLTIFNADGIGVFSSISSDTKEFIPEQTECISLRIPTDLLNPGIYRVEGALAMNGSVIEQNDCYCHFEIHRFGPFDLASQKSKGILRLPGLWHFK